MARIGKTLKRLTLALVTLGLIALGTALWSLQRGVDIDHLRFGGVELEQLHLRRDGKLKLDIARFSVITAEDRVTAEPDDRQLDPRWGGRMLEGLRWIARLFSSIDIHQIQLGQLGGSFLYREGAVGYLKLEAEAAEIDLSIDAHEQQIIIGLERLYTGEPGLQGTGQLRFDAANGALEAELDILLADLLPVQLQFQGDRRQLSFSGHGLDAVSHIGPIVDLFRLSPAISVWISDYLRGDEFELDTISGTLPYDNPAQLLQSLRAVAKVRNIRYTFAQGLAPVVAAAAEVVFEDGVLKIFPENATFYGHAGGDSYVDIDFNQAAVVNVYLRSRTDAGRSIGAILEYYGIPFPYEQLEGQTDIDLTLSIALATVDITAEGHFKASDSVFAFNQIPFDVPLLDIALDTTLIRINRLDLAMSELFDVRASGHLDVASKEGELAIAIQSFSLSTPDTSLRIDPEPDSPPTIYYRMNPGTDYLDVTRTLWRYQQSRITVDAFTTPFDIHGFTGSLPQVPISVDNWFRASVSGDFRDTPPYADLQIQIHKLRGDNFQIGKKRPPLRLLLGKSLALSSPTPIDLTVKGLPVTLQASELRLAADTLTVQSRGIALARGLSSGLEGQFNLGNGQGHLNLKRLQIRDRNGARQFDGGTSTRVEIDRRKNITHLEASKLGLSISLSDEGAWQLDCPSFARLSDYSPLMRYYNLNDGSFRLSSPEDSTRYEFEGRLRYPYALLVMNDQPVDNYHFSGWYSGRNTRLNIGEKMQIDLGSGVQIRSTGVGYNLPDLVRLLKDRRPEKNPNSDRSPEEEEVTPLRLRLFARDSFIRLGESSHLPAQSLSVHFADGKFKTDLHHRAGFATLEIGTEGLSLIGNGFDDSFMHALIPGMAIIEGGTLEFQAQGTLDTIDGAVRISDSIIKDYKQLNNMLAFINTIPGLLTFNLPAYDTEGLRTKEIYSGFQLSQPVLTVDSLLIDSPELTLRGNGSVNLSEQTADMTFNLITGAKKSIARIPLLGYVLTGGEEKPSLTLKVSGDLYDPAVESTAFEEVVTYPFQLIQRTILLPQHLVEKAQRGGGGASDGGKSTTLP